MASEWEEAAKGFKFEIGQRVLHKSGDAVLVVIGRTLEQCHGGVQRHYLCEILHRDGVTRSVFNESAMEPAPAPDATIDGALAAVKDLLVNAGCFDQAAKVREVQVLRQQRPAT